MSTFIYILLFSSLAILLISLVYTWIVGKNQRKAREGQMDSEIPEAVQEHAYIRNPVFIAYALFFVLVLIFIFTIR